MPWLFCHPSRPDQGIWNALAFELRMCERTATISSYGKVADTGWRPGSHRKIGHRDYRPWLPHFAFPVLLSSLGSISPESHSRKPRSSHLPLGGSGRYRAPLLLPGKCHEAQACGIGRNTLKITVLRSSSYIQLAYLQSNVAFTPQNRDGRR